MNRHSLAALLAIMSLAPAYAYAELPEQYDSDKQTAIAALNKPLQKACVSDFLRKNHEHRVSLVGKLSYNDTVSRAVYQSFYWDQSDRGVAFTMPVKIGSEVHPLACFYAMTGQGLRFQSSQQIFGKI